MRKILFRGKSIGHGKKWIHGYYVKMDVSGEFEEDRIYTGWEDSWEEPDYFEVDPATIGEYTGICDSNCDKIFEGDIITFPYRNKKERGIVSFVNGRFYVKNKVELRNAELHHVALFLEIYVIGNIHDNPELLKECGYEHSTSGDDI